MTPRRADPDRAEGASTAVTTPQPVTHPPGTSHVHDPDEQRKRTKRFGRRLHYELIDCGLNGHHLVGADAATVRADDALVVREYDGLRWHRCLRCDSWLPLRTPAAPTRDHVPPRDEIELPLRGRPLRDRYVLRLIALDRLVHFVVLALLAAAVVFFALDREALSVPFYRLLDALQGTVGGPTGEGTGLLGELQRAFAARASTVWIAAAVLAAYAVLEGVEAIGLWRGRRWAEYLTFVATALLMVPEIYELAHTVTVTKVIAFVINIAVVVYLLVAKRLFGLRGGAAADEAARQRDSGWPALERVLPSAPVR